MPGSVFKLVNEDESSAAKLKTLIDEALKGQNSGNNAGAGCGPLDMTIN